MIKARIEKDNYGAGFWIVIEHKDNEDENTRMPITKDEVEPILEACKKYLEER